MTTLLKEEPVETAEERFVACLIERYANWFRDELGYANTAWCVRHAIALAEIARDSLDRLEER